MGIQLPVKFTDLMFYLFTGVTFPPIDEMSKFLIITACTFGVVFLCMVIFMYMQYQRQQRQAKQRQRKREHRQSSLAGLRGSALGAGARRITSA